MNDTITLKVDGDINLIKNKLLNSSDCVFPVVITKHDGDKATYFSFCYNNEASVLEKFLNAISEYIIERYEKGFFNRIFNEDYSFLTQAEKRILAKNTENFSDNKTFGYMARKKSVLLSLYDCLAEDGFLFLDGFVVFRLTYYEKLVRMLIEAVFDDYCARKEYEDFINLLKYFISVQYPRPHLINIVVLKDAGYKIIDENGKNITEKCAKEFVADEICASDDYDDLLISILITLAPEKIVIHNGENIKNKDLFVTIKRVFENVSYCVGCDFCK